MYIVSNGFNACLSMIKGLIALQNSFYIFSTITVEGTFVNNFYYAIHVIFNASNQMVHKTKNNRVIINASIINTYMTIIHFLFNTILIHYQSTP